jgi:amino acid transporter
MGPLSPLAFLLCGLGLWPVALCYAEAARSVDRTGGPYVYARDAFGPGIGFAVGWMCFANSVFSFAAVASVTAAYAARFAPELLGSAGARRALAVLVVLATASLNYRGARPGARAVNLFTFAKFAVIVVLLLALLPHASTAPAAFELPHGLSGVGAATFAALFAAQGFEVVPIPAGETRDPQRTIPRAVVGSLLAASCLYVVVHSILVLAYPGLSGVSDAPLLDATSAVAPGFAFLVMVGGLVSTLGFVSGSAFGTPRYLFAMGADGLLPRSLGSIHARFESPHRAIVVTATLVALLLLAFDYRALVGMSNVAVAVQYLSTCLAVMAVRHRARSEARAVPLGSRADRHASTLPAVWSPIPICGAIVSLWIFTQASGQELLWAFGSLVVGYAVAIGSRRSSLAELPPRA